MAEARFLLACLARRCLAFVVLLVGLVNGAAPWSKVAWAQAPKKAQPTATFNFRIGTQTFSPRYSFTRKTRLVESAERIRDLSSNILKFELSHRTAETYRLPPTASISSLVDLAQRDNSVEAVLQMPFSHYFLWVYPFSTDGLGHYWRKGMTSADREREYKELFELTTYLLTHFQGTKKTFYLGHWEGDWSLLGGFAKDDEPSDVAINGMVEWLNVRQKAIDDAKAQHRDSDVTAYGYVEVNLVRKALEGRKAVTNSVLPRIDVDYVSYSSWDSLAMDAGAPAMARRLTESLSYIESKLRRKQVPGKRVFIGEFGFPLDTVKSRAAQVQYTRAVLDAAVEWDCPFVLYWQMYENEADEGGLGRGQGLIDNRGDPTLVYAMLSTLLKDANRFVSETNARTKRQPSERDYSQFVRAWLAGRNPLVTKPTAQSIRRGQADPAGDLTQRLKGTKWRNSNNASFEWTKDGRLLHNGKEREWKVLDDKRLQVVFGSDHKDTLEFDGSLKTFKQLIRGGPNSLEGKLVSSPSR